MTITSFRNKDWIFHALWACALTPLEQQSSTNHFPGLNCELNIPLTSIFYQGLPLKTLRTDPKSGLLTKIYLDKVEVDRLEFPLINGRNLSTLRSLRKLLDDFCVYFHYDLHQNNTEDPIIALVTYNDGKVEEIRHQALDFLLSNEQWRSQVQLLQAYIPANVKQNGLYSRNKMVTSKLDESHASSADNYTKSLADFIERAYKSFPQTIFSELADENGGRDGGFRLIINSIKANFVFDAENRAILLNTDYVTVDIDDDKKRKQLENIIITKKNEKNYAVLRTISNELLNMLYSAYSRGLHLQDSFKHFDKNNEGYVDTYKLMDGLARLGIGIDKNVSDLLIQEINEENNLSFFTFNDFQLYFNNYLIKNDKKRHEEFLDSIIDKKKKDVLSMLAKEEEKKVEDKYKQTYFPPKKDQNLIASIDLSLSQNYQFEEDLDPNLLFTDPKYNQGNNVEKSKKKGLSTSSSAPSISTSSPSASLALPEKMYTTNKTKNKVEILPKWASKRSARALNSLASSYRELKKIKGDDFLKSKSKKNDEEEAIELALKNDESKLEEKSSTKVPKLTLTALNSSNLKENEKINNLIGKDEEKDLIFHAGSGIFMTYRILDGIDLKNEENKKNLENEDLKYYNFLKEREKKLNEIEERQKAKNNPSSSSATDSVVDEINNFVEKNKIKPRQRLTLVVVPDISMTLDTLEEALQPLTHSLPFIRIVLVGLIGMTNSVWPEQWILNSDLQSMCLFQLISYLNTSQTLFFTLNNKKNETGDSEKDKEFENIDENNNNNSLLFLGFGWGGYYVIKCLTNYLNNFPSTLTNSIKQIFLINSFLKINKKLKMICKDLYLALLNANIFEANELITSLFISPSFLSNNDREEVLKKFWNSRQSFQEIKLNIETLKKTFDEDSHESKLNQEIKAMNSGFYTLIQHLRGIVLTPDTFDGAKFLVDSNIPFVVIHGTENVFIDPRNASIFSPQELPPERNLVGKIEESLETNNVWVAWLKSGHEIMLERQNFILASIVTVCKLIKESEKDEEYEQYLEKSKLIEEDEDEKKDALDYANSDFLAPVESSINALETLKDLENDEISHLIDEDVDFESEFLNLDQETDEDNNDQSDRIISNNENNTLIDRERENLKNNQEKKRKQELIAERQKRQAMQQRKQLLERFYQYEDEAKQRENEFKERKIMLFEDKRSRFAAEYLIECELSQLSKQLSKEKMKQFKKLRQEEATRKVEDDMARKRSQRIEERRKEARSLLDNIKSNEENIKQLAVITIENHQNNNLTEESLRFTSNSIEVSHQILKNWLNTRHKYIESIKKQRIFENKVDTANKQLLTLENEERRLRRAIRLLELNPFLINKELNPEGQKEELRVSLMAKEESIGELKMILHQRKDQLYVANRQVQILKLILKDQEVILNERIIQLEKLSEILKTKLNKIKLNKEGLIIERDKIRMKIISIQIRSDKINKELIRSKNSTGKFIDTDVWIEGVMQRCIRTDLIKHLKNEFKQINNNIKLINNELVEIKKKILDWNDQMAQLKRDCDKFSGCAQLLRRVYNSFLSISIESIMKKMDKLYLKSDEIKLYRKNDLKGSSNNLNLLTELGQLVEKLRLKNPENRTKEEKQFVGIDLILFPEAYSHISLLEAEQMKMDEDYQCSLTKNDLHRILNLPKVINLALPFLLSEEEIQAHYLLNKYIRGKDESFYKYKDRYSLSNSTSKSSNSNSKKKILALPSSSSTSISSSTSSNKPIIQNNPWENTEEMSQMNDFLIILKENIPQLMGLNLKNNLKLAELLINSSNPEYLVEILIKESLRDRVRSNFLGEMKADKFDNKNVLILDILTEEEAKWIEIDKILSPYIYGLDDEDLSQNIKTNKREISTFNNFSNKPAFLPNSKYNLSGRVEEIVNAENGKLEVKEIVVPETNIYQEYRDLYDSGVDLFDKKWRCKLTKAQLIELSNRNIEEVMNSNDEYLIEIRKLLDKYYLKDEETLFGYIQLTLFQNLLNKTVKILKKSDLEFDRILRKNNVERQLLDKNYIKGIQELPNENEEEELDIEPIQNLEEDAPFQTPRFLIEDSTENNKYSTDYIEARRIWGSWEQVHPASQGKQSQSTFFQISTYNPSHCHPASYAVKGEDEGEEDDDDDEGDEIEEINDVSMINDENLSLNLLNDINSIYNKKKKKKDQSNKNNIIILPSLSALSSMDPKKVQGKTVLLESNVKKIIYQVGITDNKGQEQVLDARQSRSHLFSLPNDSSMQVLEMTVTIIFQGSFSTNGYQLGRLAASLFRLPATVPGDELNQSKNQNFNHFFNKEVPISVGYSPTNLISLNTPNSLGKIVIIHAPEEVPITPTSYLIVIGAASRVKYSIEVSVKFASLALPILYNEIEIGKQLQARYPNVIKEIELIKESLRITEKKLKICNTLITESELESKKCLDSMNYCREALLKDDEDLVLTTEERRNLERELDIYEVEYNQWVFNMTSRINEKNNIKLSINDLQQFLNNKETEKNFISNNLKVMRRDLPSCMRLLKTIAEAIEVATSLNTSLTMSTASSTGSALMDSEKTGDYGGIRLVTPAENVRRVLKQYRFEALNLEEQQWCLLDMVLNIHKYEWLLEQEEEDKKIRKSLNLPPLPSLYSLIALHNRGGSLEEYEETNHPVLNNPALEPFLLNIEEIKHIIETQFSLLTRQEVKVRKLLTKYHDDEDLVSSSSFSSGGFLGEFDPNRAMHVRFKHPSTYTKEEKDWVKIDKVINADIWKYYTHSNENFLDRRLKETSLEYQNERVQQKSRESTAQKNKKKDTKLKSSNIRKEKFLNDNNSINLNNIKDMEGISSDNSVSFSPRTLRSISPHSTSPRSSSPTSPTLPQEEINDALDRLKKLTTSDSNSRINTPNITQRRKYVDGRSNFDSKLTIEDIFFIWQNPKEKLRDETDKYIHKLLHKYNGSFASYMNYKENKEKNVKDQEKQIKNLIKTKNINYNVIKQDLDARARQLLHEIDRVRYHKTDFIHSNILHGQLQKFPTQVLLLYLEREFDDLLIEQIKERERNERFNLQIQKDADNEMKLLKNEDLQEKSTASFLNPFLTEGIGQKHPEILKKVEKRAQERIKRKQKLNELKNTSNDIVKVKKNIKNISNSYSTQALQDILLKSTLGNGSCLACKSKTCHWEPGIDYDLVEKRSKELKNEIERIRKDKHSKIFESYVCFSAQNGGNRIFKKQDLLDELYSELYQYQIRIELDQIDKELHDVYNCRKEYFESKYLHGYSIMLWTGNARIALERRQNRLVAQCVAQEVVDDILDNMLEGWIFGERESNFTAAGYVPSMLEEKLPTIGNHAGIHPKSQENIRNGGAQVASTISVISRMRKRSELRRLGVLTEESKQGKMLEKALEVEKTSKNKKQIIKIAKNQNQHEKLLDETERTLRFGLFMIVLMYFRAMTYLKREKNSWNGKYDPENEEKDKENKKKMKNMYTNERIKILNEENKVKVRQSKINAILAKTKIGDARRREREESERKEAIIQLKSVLKRQKLEIFAIELIQKVYRGHLGRKAARRWALKRAELSAMNSLLNAAAISIQRVYRGYASRMYAIYKRKEMAHFIALMRVQESQQDEEVYWQTHPWSRFKRNKKEWLLKKWNNFYGKKILGGNNGVTNDNNHGLDLQLLEEVRKQIDDLDDTTVIQFNNKENENINTEGDINDNLSNFSNDFDETNLSMKSTLSREVSTNSILNV